MPISVEPSGPLALPYASLATLLAWSPTYQGLVGADDAAGAIDTIYYPYADIQNAPPPVPCTILTRYPGLHWSMERGTFDQSGQLLAQLFMLPFTEPYGGTLSDPRDVLLYFLNAVGGVLEDCLTNARNPIPGGDGAAFWNLVQVDEQDTPCLIKTQDTDPQFTYNDAPVQEFLFAGYILTWN